MGATKRKRPSVPLSDDMIGDAHCDRLAEIVGADALRRDEATLEAHCRDSWCRSVLRSMRGELATRPLCVVSPADTEQVANVLRYTAENHLTVVPFGGGSGVCGGVLPENGSVVVDVGRLDRILEINDHALFVRVQAGVKGDVLEARLNEVGLSMRHFPQSIALSTVGGWVATRAAGQYSTRYGNMEDLVLALEVVLPDGTPVRTRIGPRSATGPDVQIFLGSEGTLGIVTEVVLRVVPLPEASVGSSYSFATMHEGLEAIRRILRAGWRPPVVRLYDPPEVKRLFPAQYRDENCLLLLLTEGPATLVAAENEACREICEAAGGEAFGDDAVRHWMGERNHVPSFESLLGKGLVVDTIEVATTWDRIDDLYRDVIAALRTVPGIVVASGHSSHSYAQGTNIYFTFAAYCEDRERMEATYDACWRQAMEATLAAGGTIAHHHGVGRLRVPWMSRELEAGEVVLRRIKDALDPGGTMNPGVLLPGD